MPARREVPIAAPLLAFALALGVGCGAKAGTKHSTTPIVLALTALDGGQVDLRKHRGRVVVLHLFTTWSLAAQSDVMQLIDASDAHPEHATVVGIALDPTGYRVVAAWRSATRVPYMVATPSRRLREGRSMLGRIRSEPTTIVLGPDGAIRERIDGPLPPGHLAKVLARHMRKR